MPSSLPLVCNPNYSIPFPAKHRFPMAKFALLQAYLAAAGVARPANTFRPGAAREGLIELAHCPNYVQKFKDNALEAQAMRRLGLPWSPGLLRRSITAVNGTLLTAQLALRHGLACHLAGGTHHAHYDFGSGFCVFNDLDVELAAGCQDQQYLDTVDNTLQDLLAREQPELVLYDAGVDIYQDDPLGLLDISLEGIRQRDRLVLQRCLAADIPIATVIGGGYDRDPRPGKASRHYRGRSGAGFSLTLVHLGVLRNPIIVQNDATGSAGPSSRRFGTVSARAGRWRCRAIGRCIACPATTAQGRGAGEARQT